MIVGAVRTPVGRRNGGLAEVHPADLSAIVLRALAARAGFDDSLLYDEIPKSSAERTLPLVQTLRDEALVAFEAWIDKPDRTAY